MNNSRRLVSAKAPIRTLRTNKSVDSSKKKDSSKNKEIKQPDSRTPKNRSDSTKKSNLLDFDSDSKTKSHDDDLYQQSIDIIYQCDPQQNLSKADLIEHLEHKLDRLKNTSPETAELQALEHVLRNLRAEDRSDKIKNMNLVREKQDSIVKKNKLKDEHFVAKTDLTPEDYQQIGEDEQLTILRTSKKFFEKNRNYQTPPKNRLNPFEKDKNRGNRKMPSELASLIDAKFQKF